ncbi:MAG: CotH kinase family protein [Lachnospiraceae bacterium]|nr:CotH kinase family protein [Lachnospiraceae bacterium]
MKSRGLAMLLAVLLLAQMAVTFIPATAFAVEDGNFQTSEQEQTADEVLNDAKSDASDGLGAVKDSSYKGGSIPIFRITVNDDVDPDTGEVILSGEEKMRLVNESEDHSYEAHGASCSIDVPAAYDNPEEDLLDGLTGYTGKKNLEIECIRGRGNSTWKEAKKPYKIKLDKKANLFGMGKNKHWGLIANVYDPSLIGDRVVGWMGEQMGMPYTPRCVPVDLFINDKYCGSYVLAETVRIDENRVDIDEVDENASDIDSIDITGGYLIGTEWQMDMTEDEIFRTDRDTIFSYDTPSYELSEGEELTQAQKAQQEYIKAYMNRVEDAVYGKNFKNQNGESVWDLIDMQSFADYWLIQEFTCNPDAFNTPSSYLYKLRDKVESDGTVTPDRLYWGPLWDFDQVWGEMKEEGFDNTSMKWLDELKRDPNFMQLIIERWSVLDKAIEEITKEGGLMDSYIAEMTESWDAENELWQNKPDIWASNPQSCEEAINEFRYKFEMRRAWFNANIDSLKATYYSVTFMDGENEASHFYVKEGDYCGEAPEAEEKEGLFFKGWFNENHEEYDQYTEVCSDMIFYAEYVDESTISKATDIFFALPEMWFSNGGFPDYDIFPADAQDKRIVWTSSDEDIAVVGDDGYVTVVDGCLNGADTAEVTITAKLVGSGNEASIRIIVFDSDVITLPPVSSLSYEKDVALSAGEYKQLVFTMNPTPNMQNMYFEIRYESADESIATVSSTGVVNGISPGNVKIFAIATDDEGDIIAKEEINVTVANKEEDEGQEPETESNTDDDSKDDSKDDFPSAPDNPPDGKDSPATGDKNNMSMWIVLMVLSAVGVSILTGVYFRRK